MPIRLEVHGDAATVADELSIFLAKVQELVVPPGTANGAASLDDIGDQDLLDMTRKRFAAQGFNIDVTAKGVPTGTDGEEEPDPKPKTRRKRQTKKDKPEADAEETKTEEAKTEETGDTNGKAAEKFDKALDALAELWKDPKTQEGVKALLDEYGVVKFRDIDHSKADELQAHAYRIAAENEADG